MFCPKCGKETDASGKFCQWCGADIESAPVKSVATPEEETTSAVGVYAGLGRRFIAFIIDIILILIFDLVVASVLGLLRGLQNPYFYLFDHQPIETLVTGVTTFEMQAAFASSIIAAYGILFVVIPWLYYAGFESSRSQATPGKVLMRSVVTDLDGNRVSFARATLRFFGKFISLLIIFIGFLMIGLTKKKQGLHDKIARCLVLLQD